MSHTYKSTGHMNNDLRKKKRIAQKWRIKRVKRMRAFTANGTIS